MLRVEGADGWLEVLDEGQHEGYEVEFCSRLS